MRRLLVGLALALAFTAIAQRQPDRARAELALIQSQHPTPSQAARLTYDLALLELGELFKKQGRLDEAKRVWSLIEQHGLPGQKEAGEKRGKPMGPAP